MSLPQQLIKRLSPTRVRTSPKMTAIVGYLLGQKLTSPEIAHMMITSDGFVLARHAGDVGYDNFVGSLDDLNRNLAGYFKAAGANRAEIRLLAEHARRQIGTFGPVVHLV